LLWQVFDEGALTPQSDSLMWCSKWWLFLKSEEKKNKRKMIAGGWEQ